LGEQRAYVDGVSFFRPIQPLEPLEPSTSDPEDRRSSSSVSGVRRISPLVGRERDAQLAAWLLAEGSRLVTIVGPAGIERSALAHQLAREHLSQAAETSAPGSAPTCVIEIEASGVEDIGQLCQLIAEQLLAPDDVSAMLQECKHSAAWVESIGRALQARGRCLIFLNSFDTLASAAAASVDRWLAMAPEMQIVVSVTKPLGLHSEITHEMAPEGTGGTMNNLAAEVLLERNPSIGLRAGLKTELERQAEAVGLARLEPAELAEGLNDALDEGLERILVLEATGRWFERPGLSRVECERRPILRRLLVALVRARLEQPGRSLDFDELLGATWPGERMRRDAAKNRLKVMLFRLRSLGLRDVVQTSDVGYHLAPDVQVRMVE
jgi:hypothetical protein